MASSLTASPFSLFDADLPLLAVDAAAEIDALMTSNESIEGENSLEFTTQLLFRLASIAANSTDVNVDSVMYEQSFLPTIGGERHLFEKPTSIQEKLDELLKRHAKLSEPDAGSFLVALREFFLEVSSFASSSRRLLRIGSNPYPNATM